MNGLAISFPFPKLHGFILRDSTISRKTVPHDGGKKEKRSYGKARNNKTTLKILSFIRILYPHLQFRI